MSRVTLALPSLHGHTLVDRISRVASSVRAFAATIVAFGIAFPSVSAAAAPFPSYSAYHDRPCVGPTIACGKTHSGGAMVFTPDGTRGYAAAAEVVMIQRDPATGALQAPTDATCTAPVVRCLPAGGTGGADIVMTPDGRHLYIANGGIRRFDVDPSTGALSEPGAGASCLGSAAPCSPLRGSTTVSRLDISADGRTLVAVGFEPGRRTLVIIDVASDGAISQRPGVDGCATNDGLDGSGGACTTAPIPTGDVRLAGSTAIVGQATIATVHVPATGQPNYVSCAGDGCPIVIAGGRFDVSPDGSEIAVADGGGVSTLHLAPDGTLSGPVACVAVRVSCTALRIDRPVSAVYSPSGDALVALGALVETFDRSPSGALTARPDVNACTTTEQTPRCLLAEGGTLVYVTVSPDGRTIYESGGGDAAIRAIATLPVAPRCRGRTTLTVYRDTPTALPTRCSDPNGDTTTITASGAPTRGRVSIASGVATYVPNAAELGTDHVALNASDGTLTTTVDIVVTIVPQPVLRVSSLTGKALRRLPSDHGVTVVTTTWNRGVTINGSLVDGSGAPLANTIIEYAYDDVRHDWRTDANGRFTLKYGGSHSTLYTIDLKGVPSTAPLRIRVGVLGSRGQDPNRRQARRRPVGTQRDDAALPAGARALEGRRDVPARTPARVHGRVPSRSLARHHAVGLPAGGGDALPGLLHPLQVRTAVRAPAAARSITRRR